MVRSQAERRFHAVVDHFRQQASSPLTTTTNDDYDRVALLHYTYKHAQTETSRHHFLQAFSQAMAMPLTDT